MFRMRSAVSFIAIVLAATSALAQTTTETPPTPTLSAGSISGNTLTIVLSTDLASSDPTYIDPAVTYFEVTSEYPGAIQKLQALPSGQNTISLDLSSGGTTTPLTPIKVTATAVSSTGAKSAASAPFTANTAPAAPTGVTGIGGPNRVTVSWQPSTGAAKYMVTLSNGMSFTTTSTSQVFSDLPTATSYNAMVWAYNSIGAQSASSAVVKVSTAKIMSRD